MTIRLSQFARLAAALMLTGWIGCASQQQQTAKFGVNDSRPKVLSAEPVDRPASSITTETSYDAPRLNLNSTEGSSGLVVEAKPVSTTLVTASHTAARLGTNERTPTAEKESQQQPLNYQNAPSEARLQETAGIGNSDSTATPDLSVAESLPSPTDIATQPSEDGKEKAAGEIQPVEYFIGLALSRHPELQAARQRVAAARNVIPQVKSLPDPTFTNTFWPLTEQALQTAAGRLGNQMALNQAVPFPDKLKTKASIAFREIQIAEAEAEEITRKIAESVRLAYYEVWYADRAIAIAEATKTLVGDLTKVAEARYRSGGSQQDVLRAQLENDRLDEQLVYLRQQKELAQADLATLLQLPLSLMPETTPELAIDDVPQQIDAIVALAEQQNPKLQGLAWEIQRDREKQRLACLQQYPDFNVGLNWGLISDRDDVLSPVANGNDNLSLSFGTTLPLWRGRINAGVREAAHQTASTRKRLEAERDAIFGKLRRLIAEADALVEQQRIYRERIIPRSEDVLKLAIADYRGNRTDFFTLIETYRELLIFETQLARIRASLAGTLAEIDRTAGSSF